MSSAKTASAAFEVCRQWVEAVTGLTTIYVHQPVADAPRPELPYCAVDWPTDSNLNGTPHKRVGDPIEPDPGDYDHEYIQTERHEGVFRVECFGPGALDTLNKLRPSINHMDQVGPTGRFREAGIAVRMLSPAALDSSELRDTAWEESAIVDFAVLYTYEDVSAVAIIETVTADVTVTDQGGGAPLDTTITASFA
jgi:hypothetical protein